MTPLDLRPGLETRHRTQRQALPRQAPGRHALPRHPGRRRLRVQGRFRCQRRSVDLLPPRSPQLNGHVERNNGTWRYEASWDLPDDNLDHINRWIDAFADEFNTFRPHQALGGHTPAEYLTQPKNPLRLICPEPGYLFDIQESKSALAATQKDSAEDWKVLMSFLPSGWQRLATGTGALKGLRICCVRCCCMAGIRCGTVVWARNLADFTAVALMKRLRKSKDRGLVRRAEQGVVAGFWIRAATTVKEPGTTGARLHYSVRLPARDFFKVTATFGRGSGESFSQFPIRDGDRIDRG